MADETGKNRLGRGLAALIGEVGEEFPSSDKVDGTLQKLVAIEFIKPNPRNPRKHFDTNELEQLASSIRQRGIIQPIVVRAVVNVPDSFEIVAGERRWRAAQRAGLQEVPVVVIDVDDKTSLELAIIENVQRADLNPIDEATGYERLIQEFAYSHNELAQILGKSRSYVANSIRLLNLPASVQEYVTQGELSAGHARALLAVENSESVARKVIEQGLTVRDLERLAQKEQESAGERTVSKRSRGDHGRDDPDTRLLETVLKNVLSMNVKIIHKGQSGEVRIHYQSLEQLELLCRRFNESDPK